MSGPNGDESMCKAMEVDVDVDVDGLGSEEVEAAMGGGYGETGHLARDCTSSEGVVLVLLIEAEKERWSPCPYPCPSPH